MSSHIVYPEIEPSKPATFSRKLMHDHLRLEFGYSGVVLTDDLKMGAISKTVSLREAAPLAVKAGHDLLLVCSDPLAQRETFDALVWSYKKKDLKSRELEESVERITRLRNKRKQRFFKERKIPEKEGQELARQIARRGTQILKNGFGILPLSPAGCLRHSLAAIFPDLSSVSQEHFIEPELLDPGNFLKRTFSQFGISLNSIELVSPDPGADERRKMKEQIHRQDLVLFFCWDAHLFNGNRELLQMLQETARRLVVVLLRDPQDADWIRPETACVTAFGYRVCQIEASIEKLFSGG